MATRKQIDALYKQYLGRSAEDAGANHWLNSIDQGATLADVEYNIANSLEAQNYKVKEQLDEVDIFSDTTAEITEDDEKIAIALNLVANSPDPIVADVAAVLNENRPAPVMKGQDGQLHKTNAVLDANGNWNVNPDEEAAYYFTQPLEDDRYNNYGQSSDDYSRNYGQGNYYTEDEIKEFWEGNKGTGMELFKEQNPNLTFDDYLSFVEESNQLYVDNPNATYADNQQNVDSIADKYGITTTYTDKDGQVWGFNGSGLSQTKFVDTSLDVGNLIMGAAATALTAGALGPTVSGYLGGGALGKAGAAGISNVAGQLASTGSVDPAAALASAVTSGINPGGMLAENFGVASGTGVNIVPTNVVGGFVQSATNDLISNAITEGTLDLESALVSGLIGGGTKAVADLLSDTSQFSVESEMERIKTERALTPELTPPLSTEELYAAALTGTMVGKSDLGGLIGEGGLLPFIDPVSTTGLNNLLGGGAFSSTDVFIGPDGKQYTDLDILAGAAGTGVSPADIYYGNVPGWSSGIITYENTILGDAFDFAKENIPGVSQVVGIGGDILDAAANQQFKSTYGSTPEEFLAAGVPIEQIQQMIAYGPLDEAYNFAVNPRGDSQIVGLLSGIPGLYTTGANNPFRGYGDPTAGTGTSYIADALTITDAQDAAATANADAGGAAIVNLSGTETAVSANTVLPGLNTTVADAIIGGFIDGVLVDGGGNTATVSTGGDTTTKTIDGAVVSGGGEVSTGAGVSTDSDSTSTTTNTAGTEVTNITNTADTIVSGGTTLSDTTTAGGTTLDTTTAGDTTLDTTTTGGTTLDTITTPTTVLPDTTTTNGTTNLDTTTTNGTTNLDTTTTNGTTNLDTTTTGGTTLDTTTAGGTTLDTTTTPTTVLPETTVSPTTVLPETTTPPTTVLPPSSSDGGGGGGGSVVVGPRRGGTSMFEPQNIGMPGMGDPALLAALQFPIVNFLSESLAKETKNQLMSGMLTGRSIV